jgi:glycosyltransferase involved in cell wall biosynthesis
LIDPYRSAGRDFFLKAERVFFVSRRNLETTERNLVCRLPQAIIVSNPANIASLTKRDDFPDKLTLSLGCVARLDTAIKNQDMLIQALSHHSWANRDFVLNFYGSGPGEKYLKELVDHLGLRNKVKFHGHVNEVKKIWEDNQIMVLPSSSEGSPLSIIEAMYCSRPVLATDVGGNSELIDETCGFLMQGANMPNLSAALEKVWTNRHRLKSMGENAFRRIVQIHDPQSHFRIYDQIRNQP